MAILFNKGNTTLSDILDGTKPLQKVGLSGQFHTALNYFTYMRHNEYKEIPITFEQAGTLESIIMTFRFAQSHYERSTISRGTITLQEDVGGTWTDRAVGTFTSDEYLDFSNGRYNFQDIVRIEFDTPYPVDTTANKWRLKMSNVRINGTDSAYWYVGMVRNDSANLSDSLMVVPIFQETQVFNPATDILFFQDTITSQDDNVDFEGQDITGYNWYAKGYQVGRLAIVPITTKLLEPASKFHILKPTLSEVTIGLGGNFYLTSSYGKRESCLQIGTPTEKITQDHKVNLLGFNHSATYKGMFNTQYTFGYGQHREIEAYGEIGNYRTELSGAHQKGDTDVKVKGNFSFWKVGEYIQLTFPRYTVAYSYNDYNRQDVKQITSVSYDAGTDTTTFGIDSALTAYYDLSDYGVHSSYGETGITITEDDVKMYVYNIQQSAPIHIGVKETDYSYSATSAEKLDSYNYVNAVEFNHFEGVLMTDWYRARWRATYSKYRHPEDKKNNLWKDVFFWNSYTNYNIEYLSEIVLDNVSQFRNSFGGNSTHIALTRVNNVIINNGFAYGCSYPIYSSYSSGATINNLITESSAFHYNAAGTSNFVFNNCIIRKATYGIYFSGGNAITSYNMKVILIDYRTNYLAPTSVNSGLCYINTSMASAGQTNFYNTDILYTRHMVKARADSSADIFFKNTTAQKVVTGVFDEGQDEIYTLGFGTKFAYENFLGDNAFQRITENEKEWGEDDGNGGLMWRVRTHDGTYMASYKKNTPITIANVPISVTAKIKIEDASFWAGQHELPKLKISGLGITQPQAEVQVLEDTGWQYITATGIPTETGFMDIEITYQSDSDNRDILIDNIETLPQEPRATTDQNTTYRGASIDTLIAEKITSFGVWSADKNIDYGENSMASLEKEKFVKILQLISMIDEIPDPIKNTESELHAWLNTYANKDDFKANVQAIENKTTIIMDNTQPAE